MAFSDHKIAAFTHKITDLPDQPNLPADELKARFDSSPEELRQAHNALCDDADRLDDRVSGIIAETFGDAIPKSMLSDELQDELDAKAVETSVASRFTAEQTARESADTALDTRVDALETALPEKCEVYVGTYSGSSTSPKVITLPFEAKAAIVMQTPNYIGAAIVWPYKTVYGPSNEEILYLYGNHLSISGDLNYSGRSGCYIVFK